MRNAFIDELTIRAKTDEKIFLMVGDLGYGVIEEFSRLYPKQFLNAGVAEQNMMGMAAGLASAGYKVFVYSIANFPTLRCLEQLRNDVCYHNFNITIVSIGAGLSYGTLGYSHHAIEDVAILRALPNIKIFCPSDPIETRQALNFALSNHGPKYLRLGKNGEETFFNEGNSNFPAASTFGLSESKLKLVSTGSILKESLNAQELLSKSFGISSQVVNIPCLKPLQLDAELIKNADLLVSIEEHTIAGGLGTLLSEFVLKNQLTCKVLNLGLPDEAQHFIGNQDFLRDCNGLTGFKIAETVAAFWKSHSLS